MWYYFTLSRPRDDARTVEIMNELTAGRVPREMNGNGADVEVVLIDKQNEMYEAPFSSENWRGGAKGSIIGNIANTTAGIDLTLCSERFMYSPQSR